ncbi:MAG: MoxR family ATPase [Deltaproteobacteria bacterium]|nr:MoxR family ATPase [Deltaproteobacteria bacterium]
MTVQVPSSVADTRALLDAHGYRAGDDLATAVYLALRQRRPLFLEGEAGVGKTELAKVIAQALDRRLIRLQCYEGLDLASAVYEWDYARQMIAIRIAEGGEVGPDAIADDVFSERFLVRRPLLQALDPDPRGPPVLLVDELDRADEPFEAFLLEVLSDWQVTVPEVGTLRASEPPIVVITSNRTREVHDALRRRCFYCWIEPPDAQRELVILRRRAPHAAAGLAAQVAIFVQRLRARDLFKQPGVAESIDWISALVALDRVALEPGIVHATLGVLLKYKDDLDKIHGEVDELVRDAIDEAPRLASA